MSTAQFKFKYWPRYVSRLLRLKMEYRGDLMGWKLTGESGTFRKDTKKDYEEMEGRIRPLWRHTEEYPWNIANRLSTFPFSDAKFNVEYPDGRIVGEYLKPMPIEDQLYFKGDRVEVLVGPDAGKIGLVGSVLKQRNLCLVEGLNIVYKYTGEKQGTLSRQEVPLHMDTEVAHVDPVDGRGGSAQWRYTEDGRRVRVAMRSGQLIPLPARADMLDDMSAPQTTPTGTKDTLEESLLTVSFRPTRGGDGVDMFEHDVADSCGFEHERRQRGTTFWY